MTTNMTTSNCRILIIEDCLPQADLFAELLEAEFPGVVIEKAVNADQALALAAVFRPQVVISDEHLPGGMSGSDAVRILRSQLATFKALLVCGDCLDTDAAGPSVFDARLDKPVRIDDLLSAVRAWIRPPHPPDAPPTPSH